MPDPEGVTPLMDEELSRRWRAAPPEEAWYKIYQILFPGEQIPSPCKLQPSTLMPKPRHYLQAFHSNTAFLIEPVLMVATDFDPIQDNATSSPGSEMPSRGKLQRAIRVRIENCLDDDIRSLPEHTKSLLEKLVQEAEEECYPQLRSQNPAQQGSNQATPMPASQQENALASEGLTAGTQNEQQVSLGVPAESAESGSARSKGKGKGVQFDTSISEMPSSSSATVVEASPLERCLDGCFCMGPCANPSGECPSMMYEYQLNKWYTDSSTHNDN
jgi:hypothetical protein